MPARWTYSPTRDFFFSFGETLFCFSFLVSLRDVMASQARQWRRSPAPSLLSPLYFGHAAISPMSSPPFLFTASVRLNPSPICPVTPLLLIPPLSIKPPSSPTGRFTQILSVRIKGSALGPLFVAEALASDNPPLKSRRLDTA